MRIIFEDSIQILQILNKLGSVVYANKIYINLIYLCIEFINLYNTVRKYIKRHKILFYL